MFDEEKEILEPTEEIDKPEEGQPESEEEVDYRVKFEESERLRKKAEARVQFLKEKKGDEDVPVTKKDLEELEANLTRRHLRAQVESRIKEVAENEDEAKLILLHYESSLVPTGDIKKDVSRARLLANEAKLEREHDELLRAAESKRNRGDGFSGGKPEFGTKEPELDSETKKLVRMNKMTWDPKERLYKNERGVNYDPKTGVVKDPKR